MVAAKETTLRELLEGTKQYQVPLYQRTFSWSGKQLEQLWEDVRKLAEDRAVDEGVTHFIGSLVLAPSPDNGPAGLSEYLVVDGQQRLTSLSILLCAIRDHRATHEHPRHRDRIDEQYLINKWEDRRPKLVPTQADQASYVACLGATAQAGGTDQVGAAYQYFTGRLALADDPEDPLDIARIEDAVISGLALVAVTAQHGDNVYRIFESLNNTGLKLSQADLLRNYLFMRLPTRSKVVYQSLWLPLQESLKENMELLFWLDLVQRDPRVKQTDVYARQQARLNALRSEKEIEVEVERFNRLGALLRVILHPEEEKDPSVRLRLERLKAWGTTTVYPLLLHLLERRDEKAATSEQIAVAMLYVESFFVRRLLIGRATANINRILLSVVTEMSTELSIDEAVRTYLSAGRKHYAGDDQVRSSVRSMPYYLNGRPHQRNLVLRWLEESHGNKEPVRLDSLTIEHVLPQTPTMQWRQELAADLEPDENPAEAYEALVHTLGNLTLTGYNSSLGNSSFAVKREKLRTSGVSLNREIAAQERWGRAQIHARAESLADRIISLWPGPTNQGAGTGSEVPWDVMDRVLAELPAGSWTTYGDVAALIGSHPVPVGARLANHPAPNAHRVLQVEGTVSPNFRWLDAARTDHPRDVLRAEGVHFDQHERANPAQRMVTEELAQLIGMTADDLPDRPTATPPSERAERFAEQLAVLQGPDLAHATLSLLDEWCKLGGFLLYGAGEETTCFLMARRRDHKLGDIWPVSIRPRGRIEVVFQRLRIRTPFDDIALREELRQRLNQVPGVEIAAAKIAMRPRFSLRVLNDPKARELLLEQLAWFYDQAQATDSEPLTDEE
ncbi:DUF262 domain-containing protein [Micromonospora sp. NPDC023956]|uniref:GmrSD restriction endonuclease domain-containing protein n=1 Tax=Micromonospora sp. NPDC023956 TaxID=3155722 RepID=UPI0033C108DF